MSPLMTPVIVLPSLGMAYSPVPADTDELGETEPLGEREAEALEEGEVEGEALELLEGESEALLLELAELDGLSESEAEAEGLRDLLAEDDGLSEADAELEALELGETEALGDTELEGERESEALELGLSEAEADALGERLSDGLVPDATVTEAPLVRGFHIQVMLKDPSVTAAVATVKIISLVIIFSVATEDNSRVWSGLASCHISLEIRVVAVV